MKIINGYLLLFFLIISFILYSSFKNLIFAFLFIVLFIFNIIFILEMMGELKWRRKLTSEARRLLSRRSSI